MRDLTIIVAEPSAARFRTALELALAQIALGGVARLFLNGEAVSILVPPITGCNDEHRAAAGMPDVSDLYAEALAAGMTIIACQTGIHLAGIQLNSLDPRVETGGMVSLLQSLGDARLVMM